MTTNPQDQRPWNTFQSQSVAGRPRPSGKGTLQLPCNVEPTACNHDSDMWLLRTPSDVCNPSSRSLVDSVDLKFAYAKDAAAYGSHPFIADGDLDIEHTTMSTTRDVCDYLIHFSSTSSAISSLDQDDFQEFDDTDSETDVDSDSDLEAQYITIPPESPWWKAPLSSHSISFDTPAEEDVLDAPSSHSLSDVLQYQQFLVGMFHHELRRIIPSDHLHNDDWLKEVDAKLLLEPVESFKETCRRSMIPASRPLSTDYGSKPLPDVPVDFDDAEDDNDDESMGSWEWEYPSHINFAEVHPAADPCLVGEKVH